MDKTGWTDPLFVFARCVLVWIRLKSDGGLVMKCLAVGAQNHRGSLYTSINMTFAVSQKTSVFSDSTMRRYDGSFASINSPNRENYLQLERAPVKSGLAANFQIEPAKSKF